MKTFMKCITVILSVVSVVLGALAIVDKLFNKNRIEGDYLKCEVPENE